MQKYLDIYRHGVTVENFPLVMANVYKDIQHAVSTREAAEKRCLDVLNLIIDNTDSGTHDKELDIIMKKMLPGLVDAFFDVIDETKKVKCGCCGCKRC